MNRSFGRHLCFKILGSARSKRVWVLEQQINQSDKSLPCSQSARSAFWSHPGKDPGNEVVCHLKFLFDYTGRGFLCLFVCRLLLLLFFFSCAKLLYVSLFRPTGWFAVLTLKERRYLFLKNCWPVSRTRFSLSTNTTIKKDSSTSTCSARVGARPSATTCDGEQVRHF